MEGGFLIGGGSRPQVDLGRWHVSNKLHCLFVSQLLKNFIRLTKKINNFVSYFTLVRGDVAEPK